VCPPWLTGSFNPRWKLLQEHPEVGSFGDARQTGTDYSEGSFLQVIESALIQSTG
jgi:hypothetical protein